MARHIETLHYHFNYSDRNISGDMTVDLGRFEGQYSRAQYLLDSQVMADMVPYMPMATHSFINVTRSMSASIAGSGKVVAAAPPFGRFLFEGKVMVDSGTGSPYARPGAKKVLVSQYSGQTAAKEDIDYNKSAHPKATGHWFEAAKQHHGRSWIKKAKEAAGGGGHA